LYDPTSRLHGHSDWVSVREQGGIGIGFGQQCADEAGKTPIGVA
jgi:hypothetical protein